MIKLINETPEDLMAYTGVRRIEMELSSESSLYEMIQGFEDFLRASGFTINGKLDIIEDEEHYGFTEESTSGSIDSSVYRNEGPVDNFEPDYEAQRALDDYYGRMF